MDCRGPLQEPYRSVRKKGGLGRLGAGSTPSERQHCHYRWTGAAWIRAKKRSVAASFVLLDMVDVNVSCWNGADYSTPNCRRANVVKQCQDKQC